MAVTLKNKLLIAYKKLVGKAHTNSQFDDVNESIASSIQLGADNVFGETIPLSPNENIYDITNDVVEKIEFSLDPLFLSEYTANGSVSAGINDDGDGAPLGTFTSGYHAYALKLPSDYESNSSNERAGTEFFKNGQYIKSSGRLQIIPSKYGVPYIPKVSYAGGTISPLDEENYHIDTYSGVLFIQDINRIPTNVSAFLYIGKYTDEKVVVGTGSFETLDVTTIEATTIEVTTISASTYINLPELERVIVSSDRTLLATERAVFVTNNLSPSVTITLPDAALAESREYHIVKADKIVGTVVLSGSGSQELNGSNTFELNGPHQSVTLISNGTGWYVF